jgi:hypothetical protein
MAMRILTDTPGVLNVTVVILPGMQVLLGRFLLYS